MAHDSWLSWWYSFPAALHLVARRDIDKGKSAIVKNFQPTIFEAVLIAFMAVFEYLNELNLNHTKKEVFIVMLIAARAAHNYAVTGLEYGWLPQYVGYQISATIMVPALDRGNIGI